MVETILAATANDALVSILSLRSKRGRKVLALQTRDELDDLLAREGPASVVIVDGNLGEGAWDLVRRVKVEGGNRECRTPVILLEPEKPAPFTIVPEERVRAPHNPAKVAALCDALIERRAARHVLFAQEVTLELATAPEQIERASDVFDTLVEVAGFDEHDQVALSTTFKEAVGNAAEHGNKHDPAKWIRVTYLRDAEKIAFVVRDEGAGFDHSTFLSRAEEVSALEHTRSRRSTEKRPGGLGVFIMKKTCDAIAFNDRGNCIFLMKYLPKSGKGKKASTAAAAAASGD